MCAHNLNGNLIIEQKKNRNRNKNDIYQLDAIIHTHSQTQRDKQTIQQRIYTRKKNNEFENQQKKLLFINYVTRLQYIYHGT